MHASYGVPRPEDLLRTSHYRPKPGSIVGRLHHAYLTADRSHPRPFNPPMTHFITVTEPLDQADDNERLLVTYEALCREGSFEVAYGRGRIRPGGYVVV
jgi:hypothetical protein